MKKNKQLVLKPNTLYSGDCLDVMQHWDDNCIDLIYLDPPFNSNANYNILFGKDRKGKELDEHAQFTAFGDTWHYTPNAHERVQGILADTQHLAHKAIDGFHRIIPESPMLAYLSYMAERVAEMHRILKETGSFYLHCDPTASHYLKIVLDEIFGRKSYRNEIIWHYGAGHPPKKDFARKHDIIFRYSKTKEYEFNSADKSMRIPFKEIATKMHFTNVDKEGRRYRKYASGKISYLDEGKVVTDVWTDIDGQQARSPISKEYLGYPTQKPLALLKRIVAASSNEGNLVLDPFCGCGTTAHASQELKRNFLGIDISVYPLDKICRARLKDTKNLKIMGLPTSFESAAGLDPFIFEQWAVTLMQGFYPNNKQTGDGGVDGRATLLHKPEGEKGMVFAQVKQGKPGADAQRAFLSQILGGKASVGVFVTLEKMNQTPTMLQTIRAAGTYRLPGGEKQHPRLIYWSIEEHFDGVRPPLPEMTPTREEIQRDLLTDSEINHDLVNR